MLLFISAATPAAEINSKQNESLPDLGSQAAQQVEQTDKGKSLKERGADYVIDSATQGFENLTPEALESQARSYLQSQITSTAQSYIEDTLSPYGKVRSNLSIGQGGDLDGSSIDYFVPWYDNQTTVYFSQFSAQRKEDRTIGNIGIGVRHNFDEWLLGGNIFYDYDFTRGHRRLGLGTEAWTNYLKFSGNYYHPLSDWKNSEDFDFYEERPARGWDNLAPQLYDAQDKKVTLTNKPCSTDNPCVFIAKQDKEKGTVTLSSTLPGVFRWKAKAAPYDDSNYVDVTFIGSDIGGLNAFIYRLGVAKPVNLIGNDKDPLPLGNTYRFVLWRDANKDGVFQQSEKLTDEEMTQYDYKWEFTGKSINGEVGAQANTSNADIVIPATNREAAQSYGAKVEDGLQGYGLRVLYTKK